MGAWQCYDKDGRGRAEFAAFVEDIDPESYGYAFSVGRVARAGVIDTVDKEARLAAEIPDTEVRARLVAAIQARARAGGAKVFGPVELIRAIRPYGAKDGALGEREFRCIPARVECSRGDCVVDTFLWAHTLKSLVLWTNLGRTTGLVF